MIRHIITAGQPGIEITAFGDADPRTTPAIDITVTWDHGDEQAAREALVAACDRALADMARMVGGVPHIGSEA